MDWKAITKPRDGWTIGHLIGPFEVESILMEHPAVAEVGVIGKPDPVAGEVVKAFISLKQQYQPSDELHRELIGFARTRLGAVVAPKEIAFLANIPICISAKKRWPSLRCTHSPLRTPSSPPIANMATR